jgi:hypothetical protein
MTPEQGVKLALNQGWPHHEARHGLSRS